MTISEPSNPPQAQSRPSAVLKLVAATVLLPLCLMMLGLWERERGADDWAAFAAEGRQLDRIVADLEARVPKDGRIDWSMQFRRNGQLYGGPLALDQARAARNEVATLTTVMEWRRLLPPVVIVGGAIAAALSILVLLAGTLLGQVGRTSRDALVRGFSLMRRVIPTALSAQILAATAGFVAAVTFEAGMLVQTGFSAGALKLLGLAVVVVGAVVVAGSTVLGLRRALSAFEPDPLPILGRVVTAAEAPGLWRLTEALADRLGALKPDAVGGRPSAAGSSSAPARPSWSPGVSVSRAGSSTCRCPTSP